MISQRKILFGLYVLVACAAMGNDLYSAQPAPDAEDAEGAPAPAARAPRRDEDDGDYAFGGGMRYPEIGRAHV